MNFNQGFPIITEPIVTCDYKTLQQLLLMYNINSVISAQAEIQTLFYWIISQSER